MQSKGGNFMKVTVILDKTREEEIVIYAHEKSELICEIERMITERPVQLIGYLDDEILRIDLKDVYCFTIDGGKLYAVCENKKYLIKSRLYTVEEVIDKNFIKINQSSIANISKIHKFDASISGTLKVVFKNGHIDYVSRRNIKKVKERLGL